MSCAIAPRATAVFRSNCIRVMNSWALLPGGKHMAVIALKPEA